MVEADASQYGASQSGASQSGVSQSGASEPVATPHVALLIANDVVSDTRVLRYVRSMTSWGLQVTVIGLVREHEGDELEIDGARVIRVPTLPPRLRPVTQPAVDAEADAVDDLESVTDGSAAGDVPSVSPERAPLPPVWKPERIQAALAWRARKVRYAARRRARAVRSAAGRGRRWARSQAAGARRSAGEVGRDQRLAVYTRFPGLVRWRRVLPEVVRHDALVGPLLDRLAPDVIHPHDVFFLGTAVEAAERARAAGREVHVVYDAREYLPGLPVPPARHVAAYVDLEREHIGRVDSVITVSAPIAVELQRVYALTSRPSLVYNAPIADSQGEGPDVRSVAGVPADRAVVLYGGGLAAARGVHTVVEALPSVPDAHLVVVSRAPSHYTRNLLALAASLGVADRYHVVPFVGAHEVVDYFRTATVGVIPLLHAGNHDWALTNKFFEYLHAGLPIVTSDCEVQADLVTQHGIGTVFTAGDPASCAAALRAVLADLPRYRAAAADVEFRAAMSWEAQAAVLAEVYRGLLGPLPCDEVSVTLRGRERQTTSEMVGGLGSMGDTSSSAARDGGDDREPRDRASTQGDLHGRG